MTKYIIVFVNSIKMYTLKKNLQNNQSINAQYFNELFHLLPTKT